MLRSQVAKQAAKGYAQPAPIGPRGYPIYVREPPTAYAAAPPPVPYQGMIDETFVAEMAECEPAVVLQLFKENALDKETFEAILRLRAEWQSAS